jgi:hypothetical protein
MVLAAASCAKVASPSHRRIYAIHILGSRGLGFTQELFDDSGDLDAETAASIASELALGSRDRYGR